jgi:hypothetical protein
MDDDAKEPVGKVYRDEDIDLYGQIYWQDETWQAAREGLVDKTLGYILLRRFDLNLCKIDINEGDKIIQIGKNQAAVEKPLYVYRKRYRGHYQDTDGHSLVKVWFTDKKPGRHN